MPDYLQNSGPFRAGAPHVPGEFPSEEGKPADSLDQMNSGSGSGAFLGTAVGAGGAASGLAAIGGDNNTKDLDANGVPTGTAERERYFGRPAASPPSSPTQASGFPSDKAAPAQSGTTGETAAPPEKGEDHTGRNAAIAGGVAAGSGAALYGTYEMSKGQDEPAPSSAARDLPDSEKERTSTIRTEDTSSAPRQDTAQKTVPTEDVRSIPSQDTSQRTDPTEDTRSAPTEDATQKTTDAREEKSEEETHYGRDAAIAGGATAAAGAAGYGAYEMSKDDEEEARKEAERQQQEQQKEAERQQQEQEKEAERQQKEQQKEAEKQQKEQQKEAEKQEKERKKEEEKREKEERKEAEKQEKERKKEEEKREKEERKEAEKKEKERKKEEEKREKEEKKAAEKREKEEKEAAEQREKERKEAAAAEEREKEEKRLADEQAKKDEDEHNYGRDAAIAGGVGAAGAAGYGAYAMSKDDKAEPGTEHSTDQTAGYGQAREPFSPYSSKGQEAAASAAAGPEPTNTTTTQPKTEDESHYSRGTAAVGGAGAAGAGAYALGKDKDGQQLDADEQAARERSTDYPPKYESSTTTDTGATDTKVSQPEVTSASDHQTAGSTDEGAAEIGPYERSGKGNAATEQELEGKFATYGVHDENPERTQQQMEKIRKLEHEKARYKQEQEQAAPPKKEGFLHKILHPHRHKKEEENQAPASSASRSAATEQSAETTQTGSARGSSLTEGLPKDEQGNIIIQKEGADPNAPHLSVK